MKKYQLGEFEEVVLLTVGVLFKDAYGVSIKKDIETRLSRSVSVGALQTALRRMEDKGYLTSYDGEATEERGRAGPNDIFKLLHWEKGRWIIPEVPGKNYGGRFLKWRWI